MTEVHEATPAVRLRSVEDRDLDVFFDHEANPRAVEMAAFIGTARLRVGVMTSQVLQPGDA